MISLTTMKKKIKEKIAVCVEHTERQITHSKTQLGDKRAYINFFVEENKSEGLITGELADEGIYNRLKSIFKHTGDNERNYYFVLFEISLNHSRRYHEGDVNDRDDHELLYSLLLLMKEYWDEKAKLEGKQGIVYLLKGKRSDVQNKLMIDKLWDDNKYTIGQVNLYQEIFAMSTNLSTLGDHITFVSGTLTGGLLRYTSTFSEQKEILEDIFTDYQSLFDGKPLYLNKLITNRPITIKYLGEKFDISVDRKDFKRLYLTPHLDNLEIHECDFNMESFKEMLDDIKEELRIIHLISPPKENFKRLLISLCLEDENFIEYAYAKFEEKFINWSEIESASAKLIDNFEAGKYTKFMYSVSKNRGHMKKYKRELVIQTFKIDSLYFHFIYNTDGNHSPSTGRDVIISTEEKPKELNEFVIKELSL